MSVRSNKAEDALAQNRPAEASGLAHEGASAGDADSCALLAQWRLIGHPVPRDLLEARRLLRQAVLLGHEDAALMEIALCANGTGGSSDWSTALSLLQQAATRHGGAAAADLAMLSKMAIDSSGYPTDLTDPELIGDDWQIQRWRGFVTQEECAHIAMSVRDLLGPSIVADPRTGRAIPHPVRSSSAAVLGPTRESLPIQAILRRIASATGTGVGQGEPLNVLHYSAGQEYRPHMDTLPHEPNQRVMTALIYLNAGYVGGETIFPSVKLSVAGSGCDMIAFDNVRADGSPDPRSQHAGAPVRDGVKWAATRWIRAEAFNVWK